MKTMYFLLLTLLSAESVKFCGQCKHYRPWIQRPADLTMGKCSYFPVVYNEKYNIISGELIKSSSDYEWSDKARIDENLCGKAGKCFVPKNNETDASNSFVLRS